MIVVCNGFNTFANEFRSTSFFKKLLPKSFFNALKNEIQQVARTFLHEYISTCDVFQLSFLVTFLFALKKSLIATMSMTKI